MAKRIFILPCLFLLIVISCKNNSDLKGDSILAGTLYFKDSLDKVPDSNVLANTKLYIQYQDHSISSYLYSTTTGPDGKFIFNNLIDGKSYWIFTTLDTLGLSLQVSQAFVAGNNSIHITVTPVSSAQNGFIVQLQDPFHSPLANFPIYVFNSQSLADYNDSAGSIFSLRTDLYGYAYRFNLTPCTYYLNAKNAINNLMLQGRDSFVVATKGLIDTTMVLDSAKNGFSVLALDPLNTPVANCQLYVFNSLILSDSNLSAGSIFTLQTNNYGVAQKFNLQTGTYYVNAYDSVGKVVLSGKDTILVNQSGITGATLKLKQK